MHTSQEVHFLSTPIRDINETSEPGQNSGPVLVHKNSSKHQYILFKDENLNNFNYLDPHRIKEAFNDMRSLNAGGPDGMKAIVYQNLLLNMLTRISKIYKACIKISYTPQKWCEADVIFLAKSDKQRCDLPNSFRPIFMFNVIFKGLEKLVKWELERTSLTEKPLNRNQHAYSRVYNVDTALAQVVDEAEKAPCRRNSLLESLLT